MPNVSSRERFLTNSSDFFGLPEPDQRLFQNFNVLLDRFGSLGAFEFQGVDILFQSELNKRKFPLPRRDLRQRRIRFLKSRHRWDVQNGFHTFCHCLFPLGIA